MDLWSIISKIFLLLCVAILIKYELNILRHLGKGKAKVLGPGTYGALLGIIFLFIGDIFHLSLVSAIGVILCALGIVLYVKRITNITKKLNNLANKDALTGLVNRRCLYNKLNKDMRYAENSSVLFLDIDNFKNINDNIGHINADKILCAVTDEIQANLRSTDILSRFGGDEFVIILPKTSKETALLILARLQESVYKLKFENGIRINFSGGVATSPEDGTSLEELINIADEEMYKVKEINALRRVSI